jgi:hypothetical protein
MTLTSCGKSNFCNFSTSFISLNSMYSSTRISFHSTCYNTGNNSYFNSSPSQRRGARGSAWLFTPGHTGRSVIRGVAIGVGGGVTPPNNSNVGQSWSKWNWYLLKIEGKTRKNLVKAWDIRWSKLLKVMKWFALLTILKLQLRLRWKNRKHCLYWSKIFEYCYISPEKFFWLY